MKVDHCVLSTPTAEVSDFEYETILIETWGWCCWCDHFGWLLFCFNFWLFIMYESDENSRVIDDGNPSSFWVIISVFVSLAVACWYLL